MQTFMEDSAANLGIELETVYGKRNYVTSHHLASKIFNRSPRPDYLILINENDLGRALLPQADRLGIRTILINEGIPERERKFFGQPGERFRNWFCEFTPDDRQAGRLLASELIRVRRLQGDPKINIVGLSGTVKTTSSALRVEGLRDAVANHSGVKIRQVVPAYWDIDQAAKITAGLLKRYPETDIVWAASDGMAYGAVRALQAAGLHPGKDILTGGIDWTEFSFTEIKKGTFTATVGGHFMDGGWALVMIYDDYHHNLKAFSGKSHFSLINQRNLAAFQPFFSSNNWAGIDFKSFSHTLNPTLRHYDFSFAAVLKQLNQPRPSLKKR
jgi:ABC-type sugar transport system substrate-binding protein